MSTIRIGTRASQLALWQAHHIRDRLTAAGHAVEVVHITTSGDQSQTTIATFGGVGVFTKEIQRALLASEVDLAVHSLKDLPTEPIEGLALAATPPRAPVGDVLVSGTVRTLADLSEGARIGTGSLRRRAFLLAARPDLTMLDIRGNVDTRLKKLDDGDFDAIILAEAGLRRLEHPERIACVLPLDLLPPAVGQGALGLETRSDDEETRTAVAALSDPATFAAVTAERAMLRALRGGCLAPVGVWGRIEKDKLRLHGAVCSADGKTRIDAEHSNDPAAAAALGETVAEQLLDQGAAELIAASRGA